MPLLHANPFTAVRHRLRCTLIVPGLLLGLGLSAADPTQFAAAKALYDSDQLAPALVAFERIAASDPHDAEINFHLGELALRRNEPEKAIEFFRQAVSREPNSSLYHQRLGDAYGRSAQTASVFSALGFARKCAAAYQKAIELDPANIEARFSLFAYYRGAPAIIGGGHDKASREIDAIARLDPDRARIVRAALLVSDKEYAEARREVSALSPLPLNAVTADHVYLSDVEWSSVKIGWGEPARNHAWFSENTHPGVLVIVHGRMYTKGLWAHSPSRYVFPLDGKWRTFTGTVGLREGAHPDGSAVFVVRGDGRTLFRSDLLRANSSQRLQLDVSGVRELELITEPGEARNHFSWAMWADPRLQR